MHDAVWYAMRACLHSHSGDKSDGPQWPVRAELNRRICTAPYINCWDWRHQGGCTARLSLTTYARPTPRSDPPSTSRTPSITNPARPFPFTLYDLINDPTEGHVCLANNLIFTAATLCFSGIVCFMAAQHHVMRYQKIWGWYKSRCDKLLIQYSIALLNDAAIADWCTGVAQ